MQCVSMIQSATSTILSVAIKASIVEHVTNVLKSLTTIAYGHGFRNKSDSISFSSSVRSESRHSIAAAIVRDIFIATVMTVVYRPFVVP